MMARYQQDQENRGELKSFQNVFITSPGGTICCVWLSCSFKAAIKTRMNLSQQCMEGHGRDIVLLNYNYAECLEGHHVNMHSCLINVHHGKQDGILRASVQTVGILPIFCLAAQKTQKSHICYKAVQFDLFFKKEVLRIFAFKINIFMEACAINVVGQFFVSCPSMLAWLSD